MSQTTTAQPLLTQGPTLTNPDALHSVDELRQELHRANAQLLNLSSEIHGLNRVLQSMSQDMGAIVLAHLRGDGASVGQLLDTLIDQHVIVKKVPAAGEAARPTVNGAEVH